MAAGDLHGKEAFNGSGDLLGVEAFEADASVVTTDKSIRWSVRVSVTTDAAVRWSLRELVTLDAPIRWSATQLITFDAPIRWVVNAPAEIGNLYGKECFNGSGDLLGVDMFDAGESIGSDHAIRWGASEPVETEHDIRWSFLPYVERNAAFGWSVEPFYRGFDSADVGTNISVQEPLQRLVTKTAGNNTASTASHGIHVQGRKRYAEVKLEVVGTQAWIGVAPKATTKAGNFSAQPGAYGYGANGRKFSGSGSGTAFGASYKAGDVVMVALDVDKVWFGKNGVWQGSGNPATGANPAFSGLSTAQSFALFVSLRSNGNRVRGRFADGEFSYAKPAGFTAWSHPYPETRDRAARWSLRQSVSTDKALHWSVKQNVSTDKALRWSFEGTPQPVETDHAFQWSIFEDEEADFALRWSFEGQVQRDLTLIWGVGTSRPGFDPTDVGTGVTVGPEERLVTKTGGNRASTASRISWGAGHKRYASFKIEQMGSILRVGVAPKATSKSNFFTNYPDSFGYSATGQKISAGVAQAFGASFTIGDVIGVAIDPPYLWFSKNGVWQGGGDPATGTNPAYSTLNGGPYSFFVTVRANGSRGRGRFTGGEFEHYTPAGFEPWSEPIMVQTDHEIHWSGKELIEADAPVDWSVNALVESDHALSWSVANSVSTDATLSWSVNVNVTSNFDIRWSGIGTVYSDHGLSWSTQELIERDRVFRWSVIEDVAFTPSLHWSVNELIVSDHPLSWQVKILEVSDHAIRWHSRENVEADRDLSWSVKELINADHVLSWSVHVDIETDHAIRWSTRENIEADAGFSWSVNILVDSDHPIRWSTFELVESDHPIRWSGNILVEADAPIRWQVKALETSDHDIRWHSRENRESEFEFHWLILQFETARLRVRWRVESDFIRLGDPRYVVIADDVPTAVYCAPIDRAVKAGPVKSSVIA